MAHKKRKIAASFCHTSYKDTFSKDLKSSEKKIIKISVLQLETEEEYPSALTTLTKDYCLASL